MAVFDEVREHLESSLGNSSPDEVVAYLDRWLRSGVALRLMLGSNYVNYPSANDLPGRNESMGLPVPWRFNSTEAAGKFCKLVEAAFTSSGATCHVER